MQHKQRRLWCPGITILFLCLINAVQSQRYEFKHSLRPPFYLGRGGSLPFWEFGGSTVILEDYVRLTPTSQSKVGWLWNTVPVEMDSWEVHVDLQIGGGGKIGADGMGIWYVADPKQEGPVMGNKDYFTGVGVVFDSFDNDGQNDNPNIGLVVNDGSKPFEAQQDGSTLTVGKCKHLPWRDRKTKVKISYQNEWLNVLLESPYGEGTWQNCVTHQIKLEKGYYFGVTAATGYLFDNHDIFSWVTYNLDPWKQPTAESLQHAGIKQRLDSLTNQDMTQDETQPSQLNPIQQTVEQTQTLQPIQRQVQELAPMQPVQQPVQAHSQQQVMQPLQQHVQTQQQLMQPIQHSVQPTHNQVDSVATPPIQQPPDKTSHELWTGVKQLQVQMDSLQQQQAQIVASVNQLTAELRSLASARQNSGTAQPHIFADALEKLLAIVSDTKTVMADDAQILRNNLLDIKHSLSAGATGGANRELVTIVSDVSKKVANVQTALETAKREQASIVADLQANKEVLVSKIEQGSSFGFWSFFIFFQFCFGVAFFLWRKMRDDASKKFD